MNARIRNSIARIGALLILLFFGFVNVVRAGGIRNMGPEGGCIFDMTTGSVSTNPETLYVACLNGGIYTFPIEEDWSMTSWSVLREEIPFESVALFKDLNNNRVLLAGTLRSGLFRSDNSSITDNNFRRISGLDGTISFTSIGAYRLPDPDYGCDTVFAVCDFYQYTFIGPNGNGIYVSTNAGVSWDHCMGVSGTAFPNMKWTNVYAHTTTRGKAYALCSEYSTQTQNYTGIWATEDAGQTWSRLDADPNANNPYQRSLASFFDPTMRVTCLYQSPDKDDTLYFCAYSGTMVDAAHEVGFCGPELGPQKPRRSVSVIGMIDLTQSPPEWTVLGGFPTDFPFKGGLIVHDTDDAGADTIWVSVNLGGVWRGIGTIPDLTSAQWEQVVTDLYTWYPRSFICDLGRLDGTGACYDSLYFGTWIAGVWSSDDAAGSWQEMNKGMKNSDNRALTIDFNTTPNYTFYTGTWSHGLQKSDDWGASWSFWGEETELFNKARFNRQFQSVILNPFSSGKLLVGTSSYMHINTETGQRQIPGGLWSCTASTFTKATNDIPTSVTVTCIDTVYQDRDAMYCGTGVLPLGSHTERNPLYRCIGSPSLTDPLYTFSQVTPRIPFDLGILSVLIDRADPSRESVMLGLGARYYMQPGAIIYGPVGNGWEVIIRPEWSYQFKNTAFTHLRKHPTSNDTIFASSVGWDGERYGGVGADQWGCLLQIYRDSGGNWHYWDVSPPISVAGTLFYDNAVLGLDVRQRTSPSRTEIVAALFNNHNIPPASGNFQFELHLLIGVRNSSGSPNTPWNWFSDEQPELTVGQTFNPGVLDVKFAPADVDSVYLTTTHSIICYDISDLSWP